MKKWILGNVTEGTRYKNKLFRPRILSSPEFSSLMDRIFWDLLDLGLGISYSDAIFISVLLLMDDITLIAEKPHELQLILNCVFSFLCRWHFTISGTKSKFMGYWDFIAPLPKFHICPISLEKLESSRVRRGH